MHQLVTESRKMYSTLSIMLSQQSLVIPTVIGAVTEIEFSNLGQSCNVYKEICSRYTIRHYLTISRKGKSCV